MIQRVLGALALGVAFGLGSLLPGMEAQTDRRPDIEVPIPIELGGTGATTAADALSNLGGSGTLTVADIPDLPASKITSGTFGTARLTLASASSTSASFIGVHRYSFNPRNDGPLNCEILQLAGDPDADDTMSVFQIRRIQSSTSCMAPNIGTTRWDYLTASDNPSIWVRRTALGAIVAVWEAEDPPASGAAPMWLLPGETTTDTIVSIGPPPVAALTALYAAATPPPR